MSNWLHVAGIIRIDSLRFKNETEINFDELIGRECLFDSPTEIWEDCDKNPNKYLPMGSEGTLRKSIWINPNKAKFAAYTVSIFGDLRHRDDAYTIIKWFKKLCEKIDTDDNYNTNIRQAVITVNVDWTEINYTYTYEREE